MKARIPLAASLAALLAVAVALTAILPASIGAARAPRAPRPRQAATGFPQPLGAYLGFDRNDYPGDAALDAMSQTFAFCGYWLNAPPGGKTDTWLGKRAILRAHGFGFLVLFNGRLDKELKSKGDARGIGAQDAAAAVNAARQEGFPAGTIIYLDVEEGGRMLPEQMAYIDAWMDGVEAPGYGGGVYCSGIPAVEAGGDEIITADDIQANAGGRKISFFVYNDVCPPSPGCDFNDQPLTPDQSGIGSASVWQFAQSPERRDLTALCPFPYDSDGNCNVPVPGSDKVYVDLDAAASRDPSNGR